MASRIALLVPGFALALASALLLPQAARADIVPPDLAACGGKARGDACEDGGQPGTCQPDRCSKLDYSNGTPPSSVDYDCIKCVAGAPTPAAAATTTPTPATAPATAPTTAPTPIAPGPKAASGCTIAGDGGGLMLALLLLATTGYRRSRRPVVAG